MYLNCLKIAGITTGIVWILLALPLYFLGEPPIVWGVIGGCLLSAFCFTTGFYAVYRSFHASFDKLMIAVFGGMLARLVLIGGIFLLVITRTSLHVTSFLSSLLGFYVLYLVIEMYFLKQGLVKGE
ncbi:MAG: ATP synthase subunit I [Candidatus Tectomicrobia bacterium]